MIGEVIAHFILPATYNTIEAIEAWLKRNGVGTQSFPSVVYEVGMDNTHVYFVSPYNVQQHPLNHAGGEYVA